MNNFYGDKLRWFIGICECISDPLHLGRVRVRIYGVHGENLDEVPESSLPWATVMIPTTEDGVSGLGRNPNLKPGAMVFGIFTDGDMSQQPMILGSMPRVEVLDTEQNTSKNNDAPEVSTQDVPNTKTNSEIPNKGAIAYEKGLVGTKNVEKAYNFLISNGYKPVTAAAIIGNFMKESQGQGQGIRPNARNPFSKSYGIAQWNPQPGALRYQELVAWANDRRLKWDTGDPGSPVDDDALLTQLQFFHWDFKTQRPGFYGYNDVVATDNIEIATKTFMDKYERPGAAEADLPNRIKYAKQTLETFG
jgi:hypothetical protein